MLAARPVRGGDARPYDVVVLGAGIAGLVTALDLLGAAPELRIAIVDKGRIGASGSTALAQGGLAAAVGPGDSPALHAEDTIAAGAGLCDSRAVAALAAEGPARVADLVGWGTRFDREADGGLALAREAGQSVPRSVRAADATGAAILTALRARATGRVERLQGIACALATDTSAGRRVRGVWLLLDDVDATPTGPAQEAGLALVEGRAVVLASGGCGGLYAATTNHDDATADGVALAAAAGADLVDLEFVQFHPTGLKSHGLRRLLLTEALRGAGAALVDADGLRFMPEVHPAAELAPRHVVTKAILDQPRGVWLDATHIGERVLSRQFPTVLAAARDHGHDLSSTPVPVEPCQHYMIGGVATDLHGRTSLPGLWAAGEVACTGAHGANRMAGNSLLESCVFAHRIARSLPAQLPPPGGSEPDPPVFGSRRPPVLDAVRLDVRLALTAGAGPIRSAASLDAAEKVLDTVDPVLAGMPLDREALELASMLRVGRLLVRSARLRTESRGVHWRDDAPGPVGEWDGVRLLVRPDALPTGRSA